MKPSEIIKLARRQTWCTEDIVTADEAYNFLNFIIEDFGADIRASDSWFGFDIVTIDVYAGNPVYTFSDEDITVGYSEMFPISKIQSVWLMGKDNKWHDIPVHFVDKVHPNQIDATGEPKACFITWNELWLIPYPKEDTRIMIWGWDYNPEFSIIPWIKKWLDEYRRFSGVDISAGTYPYAWASDLWTLYTASETPSAWATVYTYDYGTSTYTSAGTVSEYIPNVLDREEFIWIPRRWHYVLVEWLKYWMYWNMWVNFEAARANSRAFYDSEKNKAIQNIVDRWQLADTAYFPDLNFLNY